MASALLAHMDEEIAKRKQELFDFCTKRNSFSPICRLPLETLQAIFIYLARDWHGENDGRVCSTVPSWANVSYVYRRWRHVALSCSTLWSHLFVTSPRWTEELLERSKQAYALKVSANLKRTTQDWAVSCVQQIVKHAERIQEFQLHLSKRLRSNTIVSTFTSRAPRLTNLTISVDYSLAKLDWPSVLFGGDTPVLRTLELVNCPTRWYSLTLNSLATLVLRRILRWFQQNTVDFLDAIRCMPNLTILRLEVLFGAVDFLSSGAFETFQKIDLPSLIYLRIAAPLSTVIAFLRCVQIPLKTAVHLTCNPELNTSLAPLSSLLAQRLGTPDDRASTARSLLLAFSPINTSLAFNSLERTFSSNIPMDGRWDVNIPLQINMIFDASMGYSPSNIDCIIADICCLTNVRTLRVLEPPRSSTFWRRILGHLRDLRSLEMRSGLMPNLASLLSLSDHSRTENEGRGRKWACAPALEKLRLRNITFEHSRTMDGDSPHFAAVQPLCDALSAREESCGQLTMVGCLPAGQSSNVKLDMVGRWKDGQFHVVEQSTWLLSDDDTAEDD